ncbi:hypothetical protein DFJ58DRAFT_729963 [Suillus subalutaceus]|uniref:uncharacterized protein n=1 Tax=Suillus subalutaceus TaxID=48586 RepID=UPI001B882FCA|nr:uncharacterized protein DFJ58DRAFT_729963 [Suillus subalutaceus]KAG1848061.1 hypothetical protein DFJ58DRAFT_729963 [Suillus subalutaceus]
MSNIGRHVLALEVIAAMKRPFPSTCMPTGHYVRVSTSNGQWNITVKTAMADCSISWNETFTILGCPLMFLPCLMSIFSGKSKTIHLESRASYEFGPSELVGAFKTTFGHVLISDGESKVGFVFWNQALAGVHSLLCRNFDVRWERDPT